MAAPTGPDSIAKRDHAAEKHLAVSRRAARFAGIREKRDESVLSEEIFQVSQALILYGLPYQPTTERHFTRKARLGDGSTVAVTLARLLKRPCRMEAIGRFYISSWVGQSRQVPVL